MQWPSHNVVACNCIFQNDCAILHYLQYMNDPYQHLGGVFFFILAKKWIFISVQLIIIAVKTRKRWKQGMRNRLLEGTGRRIWLPRGLWGCLTKSAAPPLAWVWLSGLPLLSHLLSHLTRRSPTGLQSGWRRASPPLPSGNGHTECPGLAALSLLPHRLLLATLCHFPSPPQGSSPGPLYPSGSLSLPPASPFIFFWGTPGYIPSSHGHLFFLTT